ncbi:MAG: hypothetical protein AAF466_09745 [Bacteroidota bacterium]
MKQLNQVISFLLIGLLLSACSQENDLSTEVAPVVQEDIALLKHQLPNPLLDNSTEGLYHGVVASTTTQMRGKIWVNVANNSHFNALVELVDGPAIEFRLDPDSVEETETMTLFEFQSTQGSFTLDITLPESPVISNIVFLNEAFSGLIVKSLSTNRASANTATFSETGNPSFSGTWSFIADGSLPNPNGNNGDGITSLLITIDGDSYQDSVFDTFNATDCLGISEYVPTLNSFGLSGYTISDYQTSEFADGIAKWYLSFDAFNSQYMNYLFCETATAGTFEWTSEDATITRIGVITLD